MTISHERTRASTLKALRESIPLTQEELAIQAAVSRHAVLRQEQLCYPSPLPNIIDTLSDIVGTDSQTLTNRYLEDVARNRAESGFEYFNDHAFLAGTATHIINNYSRTTSHGKHPFQVWRESVMDSLGLSDSRIHFSQVTSIHPATLSRYESFNTGFPAPVEVAFRSMGFPEALIQLFHHKVFNMSESG